MPKWPEELQKIADAYGPDLGQYMQPVSYALGEKIYAAGAPGDSAMIIEQGEVRLEIPREELDSEKVLTTLGPGSILGELALLDGQPRSVDVIADTTVTGFMLTTAALEQMKQQKPMLAAEVYAALARSTAVKLRETNSKLAEALVEAHGQSPEVDELVQKAVRAQPSLLDLDEETIDRALYAMCRTILEHAEDLAEQAVKETRLGNAADKTAKHRNVCLGLYQHLAGKRGHGPLHFDRGKQVAEVAEAMGVIFGLVPMTNPVSTVIFKSMSALKSRNAIILSPNRIGAKVVIRTVDLLRTAIEKEGVNPEVLQVVRDKNSRVINNAFMRHKDIRFILATGGASMVRAAYSSGTPAIGVGPGNTPCFIASDADLEAAAQAVVKSKSFDNGIICGSEHNLLVTAPNRESFIAALQRAGAAVLSPAETEKLLAYAIRDGGWSRKVIGKLASDIAANAGITRDHPIRLLVVPAEGIEAMNPLAREKMTTILSLFTVADDDAGFAAARRLLDIEGAGHTAAIHTRSKEKAHAFGLRMPASRILVNAPAMQGISGLCTGLAPSLTLGCGTFGGNSTTDNVSYRHLMNIKRLAWYRPQQKTEEMLAAVGNGGDKVLKLMHGWNKIKRKLKAA